MPISLSVKPLLQVRHLWLSFLFLVAPLFFYGQTLTGLWVGALHNDSNSVRKDQSFEIALTEYRGKVFGYSRSEFIVNDTLYYIVKRVKGTIEGSICEVTDDEIISYNFRGKLDKGIRVTSTFRRNKTDSTWKLGGSWKTKATKKYYAVTGKVNLSEEKDLTASKLFPHLEELNKADEMVFYKERNEPAPFIKVAKPERIQSEYTEKTELLAKNDEKSLLVKKPELPQPVQTAVPEVAVQTVPAPKTELEKQADPVLMKNLAVSTNTVQENVAVKKEPAPAAAPVVKEQQPVLATVVPLVKKKPAHEEKAVVKTNTPAAKANQQIDASKTVIAPKIPEQKPSTVTPDNLAKIKPAPAVNNNAAPIEQALTPVNNKIVITNPVQTNLPKQKITDPAALLVKKSTEDPIKKSTLIGGRKSEFNQELYFKSDSLVLILYDNGEIDGDTVSVYLNGEVVMPSQGLKSSAIRKTIYIDEGLETFTLVMFAESLGKYPPNTGLLVIRDGNDVYNLRFSSDFQKSSGIVFRRIN